MPDPYQSLPEDDESPDVLLEDAKAFYANQLPGWQPSDASPEVAILAADMDEASTLYVLVRQDEDVTFTDFGVEILGVPLADAIPATTLTTWTARTAAPAGGQPIEPGTQLVIDAAAGKVAFEVVDAVTIPEGSLTAAGVTVQALTPGAAANGATGPVVWDAQPAWVQTVVIDAPASGGADAQDPVDHRAQVKLEAQLLTRTPILPIDFERAVQQIAEIDSALVLDGYDANTGQWNQDRTVSIFPRPRVGTTVSPAAKTAAKALVNARRETNWITRVADPTTASNTVNPSLTVAAKAGVDHDALKAQVAAVILAGPIDPNQFGQPTLGEGRSWQYRDKVRLYEIAATADQLEGVAYVDYDTVKINNVHADFALTGVAPLPVPGTVTVTVINA